MGVLARVFFILIGCSLGEKEILPYEVRKYEAAMISSDESDGITLASYKELTVLWQVFIPIEDQCICKAQGALKQQRFVYHLSFENVGS